jgi:hypothetical protein
MDTTNSLPATSPVALDLRTTVTFGLSLNMPLLPIPARTKRLVIEGWQKKTFVADDFDSNGNVGLRLDAVVDCDLDSTFALQLAPHFMPKTSMTFGRASKPRSHLVYKTDKLPKYTKYTGVTKVDGKEIVLLERRTGSGHQTVIPPSVHPSGERIYFEPDCLLTPTEVDAKTLADAFAELAVAALIASVWRDGVRHDLALAVPSFLLKLGVPADTVTKILEAVVEEFDDEGSDRMKAIEDTVSKFENESATAGSSKLIELMPDTASAFMGKIAGWFGKKVSREDAIKAAKTAAKRGTKPVIFVEGDQYEVTTDEAYSHLVAGNVSTFFQRGGALQRVRDAPDHLGVDRPMITTVGVHAMRERLMRVVDWIGGDPQRPKPYAPPEFVAQNILQMGAWPGVPILRDITETPVITHDGSIIVTPGYQPESKLWYCPAPGFTVPPVADVVTKDMAMVARDALLEVLHDFIFEDEASKAHALGFIMLPFVRELISGPTPAHGISAPRRGTGKGLLGNVAAYIATGKQMRSFSWKADEAELTKTITTFLMQNGGGVLGIDNMEGTVTSGVLASMLTNPVWTERLLGTNSLSGGGAGVPNRATWFVNGNNITFSDEIERRTAYIRLLTDRENPEERGDFLHEHLLDWITAERGRLVHAALTLARYAYQLRAAGLPSRQLLGSFEGWDALLGGLMAGIEVPGWMGNRDALRSRSTDELEEWRELVATWFAMGWGHNVQSADIYGKALLAKVLPERLVPEAGHDMVREFGKALAKLNGQVVGGFRVIGAKRGGRQFYRIVPARST